ncbi:hypothetical protein DFQ28_011248 [Apophysomyces sp. BC1034]|nr:hypothetical protein DFQ30_007046 [Apophysomyces sp. BC1015]KAG0181460.1 hypothetical protein DFQ29_008242 [Apophysomyces sp. BC1021]KAG0194447.1 hypothetical protein DFQ28_011248 [Apophysomyces sp. BC1034]
MARLTVDTTDTFRKSLTFCFYVSGHGWGHATRANQIICDILKLPAQHQVYVISTASSFIFQGVIELGARYRHADIDAGVVQPLPYTVDRELTIHNLKQFLARRPVTLAAEINWLKQVQADCVVCDAPFLPCAAAAGANIPAAIASNFTFDEVYSGLREGDSLDDDIVEMLQQVVGDYECADLLIRLPGAIRIPSFDDTIHLVPQTPASATFPGIVNGKPQLPCVSISNIHNKSRMLRRIIDVPLVFRKYKTEREDVLQALQIPSEIYSSHKILLLSFGGQALGKDGFGESLPPGWICIVCAAPDYISMPPGFYRAPKDAYVPDLTNAADVVLGKLGYGTCSECVGHGKPFVYISRPQFIEEQGLLKLMQNQGSAVEMSREDFEQGRWADAIEAASKLSGRCSEPERLVGHNGGQVAAKTLEQFVDEWHRLMSAELRILSMDDNTIITPGGNDRIFLER